MNNRISTKDFDAYLGFLGRALVLARHACRMGLTERAEAILDALDNLPTFLEGNERASFEEEYRVAYVDPLVARYPDLSELTAFLPNRGLAV